VELEAIDSLLYDLSTLIDLFEGLLLLISFIVDNLGGVQLMGRSSWVGTVSLKKE
jgi:hypothetical protein